MLLITMGITGAGSCIPHWLPTTRISSRLVGGLQRISPDRHPGVGEEHVDQPEI
jgi:hypothetical protein